MPPPPTFPQCWLWLLLPFAAAGLITASPALCELVRTHGRLTLTLGLTAFGGFCLAMVGVVGGVLAWPIVLLCGPLSGFACFYSPRRDDGGGDPAPDAPPPGGDGIDWREFDRSRAGWERRPARPRSTT